MIMILPIQTNCFQFFFQFIFHQKFGGLTVKEQPFGLASYVTPGATPFDGIIGISYEAAAKIDNSTIIDRLVKQGQIKKAISCVKLREHKKTKSELIIGGCDVEADFWIPVLTPNDKYTGWRLNLTKIVLRSTADNSELFSIETNNEAVFDTGTGGLIGNQIEKLHKKLLFFIDFFINLKVFQQNSWILLLTSLAPIIMDIIISLIVQIEPVYRTLSFILGNRRSL